MATIMNIQVPDIGSTKPVEIIEVVVKVGDRVAAETTLLTLESEKATMDLPSPEAGVVTAIHVHRGDKVQKGDVILDLEVEAAAAKPVEAPKAAESKVEIAKPPASAEVVTRSDSKVHAGPHVRRLARYLSIDLVGIKGSGPKDRILEEDVYAVIKARMNSGGGSGLQIAPPPEVDFAAFGAVETVALSRIQKYSSKNLHRNWVSIPHVTQFDEADITDLEAFRVANKAQVEKAGAKLTPLVFLMKAVVSALKTFPKFNASLAADGENLILKKYFHIGVAVDTPNGLVVPVIREVDQKGFIELAQELGNISEKARQGKLSPMEMQGGCFSISSLGGIGGTAFTPIVNLPEVAILGVSKSSLKPLWIDQAFQPRLMLPLSLSYDHRVIDGAEAARFTTYLVQCLSDLRKLLL